jgi:hypothetical protein
MIFPQEQGLAIRIYYYPPISFDDNDGSTGSSTNKNDLRTNSIPSVIDLDLDGILNFSYTFQWSMVLFVTPNIHDTTNPMNSFIERSMELLDLPIPPNNQSHQSNDPNSTTQRQNKPSPRFLVVADTAQAILAIIGFANTITPSRCALRTKYIDRIRVEHYVPTTISPNENQIGKENIAQGVHDPIETDPIYQKAAADHYAKAIRAWCTRAKVPDSDAAVILYILPTLHQFTEAISSSPDRTAPNHNTVHLESMPIAESTKCKLRRFLTAPDDDDESFDGINRNDLYCDLNSGRLVDGEDHCRNTSLDPSTNTDIISPPPISKSTGYIFGNHSNNSNQYMNHHTNGALQSSTNMTIPDQNLYQRHHQGDRYQYGMTQADDFVANIPRGHDPHLYPVPHQNVIPPAQHHRHDRNYHEYVHPSQQQTYMNQAFLVPTNEYHPQQHYLPPMQYNNSRPMEVQRAQYHPEQYHDTTHMAKVVPWGQPPPPPRHNHWPSEAESGLATYRTPPPTLPSTYDCQPPSNDVSTATTSNRNSNNIANDTSSVIARTTTGSNVGCSTATSMANSATLQSTRTFDEFQTFVWR